MVNCFCLTYLQYSNSRIQSGKDKKTRQFMWNPVKIMPYWSGCRQQGTAKITPGEKVMIFSYRLCRSAGIASLGDATAATICMVIHQIG